MLSQLQRCSRNCRDARLNSRVRRLTSFFFLFLHVAEAAGSHDSSYIREPTCLLTPRFLLHVFVADLWTGFARRQDARFGQTCLAFCSLRLRHPVMYVASSLVENAFPPHILTLSALL